MASGGFRSFLVLVSTLGVTHFKFFRGFTSFHKPTSRQKPEKQHAITDQNYPANEVTLTGGQCYPMC